MGLASYILEKFSTWTKHDQSAAYDNPITLDEALTNIMIYWFSGNIISSQRYYKENIASSEWMDLERYPVEVPTGMAAFPQELFIQPKSFLTNKFPNIVSYHDMPDGGHFAAFEQPQLLYDDIVQFVKKVEKKAKNNANKAEL